MLPPLDAGPSIELPNFPTICLNEAMAADERPTTKNSKKGGGQIPFFMLFHDFFGSVATAASYPLLHYCHPLMLPSAANLLATSHQPPSSPIRSKKGRTFRRLSKNHSMIRKLFLKKMKIRSRKLRKTIRSSQWFLPMQRKQTKSASFRK